MANKAKLKTKPKATPTPRPWEQHGQFIFKSGEGSLVICEMQGSTGRYVQRQELELDDPRFHEIHANADLILRAVNAHDALLAACDKALNVLIDKGIVDGRAELRAALALAKPNQPGGDDGN